MHHVRVPSPLLYLLAHAAAVVMGRVTQIPGTGLQAFWPAAGVAALWLLRGSTRRQVTLDGFLVLTSTTILFLVLGTGPAVALLLGTANLLQSMVIRFSQARIEGRGATEPLTLELSTPPAVLHLLASTALGSMVSAPLGATALLLGESGMSWLTVLSWVVANFSAAFCVTAAVLTARWEPRTGPAPVLEAGRRRGVLEFAVVLVTAGGSAFLVFGASQDTTIGCLLLAISAWIGFRFSSRFGAGYCLVLGASAILCMLAGWGPFGDTVDLVGFVNTVQIFVVLNVAAVLMNASAVAERRALIDRLQDSEARASARAELLDAVTTAMVDGLFVVDDNDRLLFSNPAAQEIAGVPAAPGRVGPAGKHGLFQMDGAAVGANQMPRERAMRGEILPPTDFLRVDPRTGVRRIVSISAAPLQRSDAIAKAAAVLVRDVTKSRAQQRELESFAGVVAHDLKSPLSVVMSWAEVVQDHIDADPRYDDETLHSAVRRILASSRRMSDLISELLAYAESGDGELSVEAVSLDDTVSEIARDLGDTERPQAPVIRHVGLGRVVADRTLVRQLLNNVIGNAVKYAVPGVVPHVVVGSAPVGKMLEIWVSDNGVGIPEPDLVKVFDRFYRSATTRDYPGTGLGLAICARTVERHGGQISARTGPAGVGTTITFTLPLDLPDEPTEVPVRDERPLTATL